MDTLETMEAFTRVVEAGSFTEAARRWGRSKAVVSKYVARLEARLGVSLLVRTTRSLRLTESGKAYYARCGQLLEEIADLESAISDEQRVPRGVLRVTAPPGLGSTIDESVIAGFVRAWPQVKVELNLSHEMHDLVREGYDCALRVTEPEDSTLIARRLADAPVLAYASPGYLARAGTPTHPRALREHACLVDTNFRNKGRWRFTVDGQRLVVPVDGPVQVNSPLAIRALCVAGLGIALMPAFIARQAVARGELVQVLAGFEGYHWAIYVVYPPRRHLSAKVRAFVDHAAASLHV